MDIDTFSPSLVTFGRRSYAVVPDDEADLPRVAKAVVALTAGSLSIVPALDDGTDPVVFPDVPAGFIPPFIVRRVLATGTSSSVRAVTD